MMFFYTLLYCLTLPFAAVASLFLPKVRAGFWGRRKLTERLREIPKTAPLYWFHVASSGEFEQVLPILDELKQRIPSTVFLSYFSPSAKEAVRLETERRTKSSTPLPWDTHDFLPHDLPWKVREAISLLKPKAFISIHRELWPQLLTTLHAHHVPLYLFATYWPPRTQKVFSRYKKWANYLHFVGTVDEGSRLFISRLLKDTETERLGDPRVDRVFARKKLSPRPPPWELFFHPNQKSIVFASVWKEDIEQLLPLLHWLNTEKKEWRPLLVPHECSEKNILALRKQLKSALPQLRLWSHWLQSPDDCSPLLVDRVGFLAELYRFSDFVFVGGSFKKRIHNVLEPAAYGKPILTGPLIWNSAEACEMREQTQGLRSAVTSTELLTLARQWIEDPALLQSASASLSAYLEQKRGAASRYVDVLLEGP